jgi:hypothetical protein
MHKLSILISTMCDMVCVCRQYGSTSSIRSLFFSSKKKHQRETVRPLLVHAIVSLVDDHPALAVETIHHIQH